MRVECQQLFIAFYPAEAHIKATPKSLRKAAKRTPKAAFAKPVSPDKKLATVGPDSRRSQIELTKKLWANFCKKGLQDAKRKR